MLGNFLGVSVSVVIRRLILALISSLSFVVVAVMPSVSAAAVSEFGTEGEGAGQFVEPGGIGVARESGDRLLVRIRHQRVEQFTRESEFVRTWGWGVRGSWTAIPGV